MTVPPDRSIGPADGDRRAGQVEVLLGRLLRIGVSASMAVVLAGIVIMFVRHEDYLFAPGSLEGLIKPGTRFPHTVSQVAKEAAGSSGRAIVAAGLLMLIATPVVRVAMSAVAFFHRRDWAYVALALLVLLLLLASFLVGKTG